jgi:hypothetical protein
LLKLGFEDFVRVGSLRKIAKDILPFTAQQLRDTKDGGFYSPFAAVNYSTTCSTDLKDLHSMLDEKDLLPSERRAIQETIRKFTGILWQSK